MANRPVQLPGNLKQKVQNEAPFVTQADNFNRYNNIDNPAVMTSPEVQPRLVELLAFEEGISQAAAEAMVNVGVLPTEYQERRHATDEDILHEATRYHRLFRADEEHLKNYNNTTPKANRARFRDLRNAQVLVAQKVHDDVHNLQVTNINGEPVVSGLSADRVGESSHRRQILDNYQGLAAVCRPSADVLDSTGNNLEPHFRVRLREDVKKAAMFDHLVTSLDDFVNALPGKMRVPVRNQINRTTVGGADNVMDLLDQLDRTNVPANNPNVRKFRNQNIPAELMRDAREALRVFVAGIDPMTGNITGGAAFEQALEDVIERYEEVHRADMEARTGGGPPNVSDLDMVGSLRTHKALKIIYNSIDPANESDPDPTVIGTQNTETTRAEVIHDEADLITVLDEYNYDNFPERRQIDETLNGSAVRLYENSDERQKMSKYLRHRTTRKALAVDLSDTSVANPDKERALKFLASAESSEQVARIIEDISEMDFRRPLSGSNLRQAQQILRNYLSDNPNLKISGSGTNRHPYEFHEPSISGYRKLLRLAHDLRIDNEPDVIEGFERLRHRMTSAEVALDVSMLRNISIPSAPPGPLSYIDAHNPLGTGRDPYVRVGSPPGPSMHIFEHDESRYTIVAGYEQAVDSRRRQIQEALANNQGLVLAFVENQLDQATPDIDNLLAIAEICADSHASRLHEITLDIVDGLIGPHPDALNQRARNSNDPVDRDRIMRRSHWSRLERTRRLMVAEMPPVPVAARGADPRYQNLQRLEDMIQAEQSRLRTLWRERDALLLRDITSPVGDAVDEFYIFATSGSANIFFNTIRATSSTVGRGVAGGFEGAARGMRMAGDAGEIALTEIRDTTGESIVGTGRAARGVARQFGGLVGFGARGAHYLTQEGWNQTVRVGEGFAEIQRGAIADLEAAQDNLETRVQVRRAARQERTFDRRDDRLRQRAEGLIYERLLDPSASDFDTILGEVATEINARPRRYGVRRLRVAQAGPPTDAQIENIITTTPEQLVEDVFERADSPRELNNLLLTLGNVENGRLGGNAGDYREAIQTQYISSLVDYYRARSNRVSPRYDFENDRDRIAYQDMMRTQYGLDQAISELEEMQQRHPGLDTDYLTPMITNLTDRRSAVEHALMLDGNLETLYNNAQPNDVTVGQYLVPNTGINHVVFDQVRIDVTSPPPVDASIVALDTDGDGYVTGAELRSAVGGSVAKTVTLSHERFEWTEQEMWQGIMADFAAQPVPLNLAEFDDLDRRVTRRLHDVDETLTRRLFLPAVETFAGRTADGEVVQNWGRTLFNTMAAIPVFGLAARFGLERTAQRYLDYRQRLIGTADNQGAGGQLRQIEEGGALTQFAIANRNVMESAFENYVRVLPQVYLGIQTQGASILAIEGTNAVIDVMRDRDLRRDPVALLVGTLGGSMSVGLSFVIGGQANEITRAFTGNDMTAHFAAFASRMVTNSLFMDVVRSGVVRMTDENDRAAMERRLRAVSRTRTIGMAALTMYGAAAPQVEQWVEEGTSTARHAANHVADFVADNSMELMETMFGPDWEDHLSSPADPGAMRQILDYFGLVVQPLEQVSDETADYMREIGADPNSVGRFVGEAFDVVEGAGNAAVDLAEIGVDAVGGAGQEVLRWGRVWDANADGVLDVMDPARSGVASIENWWVDLQTRASEFDLGREARGVADNVIEAISPYRVDPASNLQYTGMVTNDGDPILFDEVSNDFLIDTDRSGTISAADEDDRYDFLVQIPDLEVNRFLTDQWRPTGLVSPSGDNLFARLDSSGRVFFARDLDGDGNFEAAVGEQSNRLGDLLNAVPGRVPITVATGGPGDDTPLGGLMQAYNQNGNPYLEGQEVEAYNEALNTILNLPNIPDPDADPTAVVTITDLPPEIQPYAEAFDSEVGAGLTGDGVLTEDELRNFRNEVINIHENIRGVPPVWFDAAPAAAEPVIDVTAVQGPLGDFYNAYDDVGNDNNLLDGAEEARAARALGQAALLGGPVSDDTPIAALGRDLQTFAEFYDLYNDGVLNAIEAEQFNDQIIRVLSATDSPPAWVTRGPVTQAEVLADLGVNDRDTSRDITPEDLRVAIESEAGSDVVWGRISRTFEDTHEDGLIGWLTLNMNVEGISAQEALYRLEPLQDFDSDGDGRISLTELQAFARSVAPPPAGVGGLDAGPPVAPPPTNPAAPAAPQVDDILQQFGVVDSDTDSLFIDDFVEQMGIAVERGNPGGGDDPWQYISEDFDNPTDFLVWVQATMQADPTLTPGQAIAQMEVFATGQAGESYVNASGEVTFENLQNFITAQASAGAPPGPAVAPVAPVAPAAPVAPQQVVEDLGVTDVDGDAGIDRDDFVSGLEDIAGPEIWERISTTFAGDPDLLLNRVAQEMQVTGETAAEVIGRFPVFSESWAQGLVGADGQVDWADLQEFAMGVDAGADPVPLANPGPPAPQPVPPTDAVPQQPVQPADAVPQQPAQPADVVPPTDATPAAVAQLDLATDLDPNLANFARGFDNGLGGAVIQAGDYVLQGPELQQFRVNLNDQLELVSTYVSSSGEVSITQIRAVGVNDNVVDFIQAFANDDRLSSGELQILNNELARLGVNQLPINSLEVTGNTSPEGNSIMVERSINPNTGETTEVIFEDEDRDRNLDFGEPQESPNIVDLSSDTATVGQVIDLIEDPRTGNTIAVRELDGNVVIDDGNSPRIIDMTANEYRTEYAASGVSGVMNILEDNLNAYDINQSGTIGDSTVQQTDVAVATGSTSATAAGLDDLEDNYIRTISALYTGSLTVDATTGEPGFDSFGDRDNRMAVATNMIKSPSVIQSLDDIRLELAPRSGVIAGASQAEFNTAVLERLGNYTNTLNPTVADIRAVANDIAAEGDLYYAGPIDTTWGAALDEARVAIESGSIPAVTTTTVTTPGATIPVYIWNGEQVVPGMAGYDFLERVNTNNPGLFNDGLTEVELGQYLDATGETVPPDMLAVVDNNEYQAYVDATTPGTTTTGSGTPIVTVAGAPINIDLLGFSFDPNHPSFGLFGWDFDQSGSNYDLTFRTFLGSVDLGEVSADVADTFNGLPAILSAAGVSGLVAYRVALGLVSGIGRALGLSGRGG